MCVWYDEMNVLFGIYSLGSYRVVVNCLECWIPQQCALRLNLKSCLTILFFFCIFARLLFRLECATSVIRIYSSQFSSSLSKEFLPVSRLDPIPSPCGRYCFETSPEIREGPSLHSGTHRTVSQCWCSLCYVLWQGKNSIKHNLPCVCVCVISFGKRIEWSRAKLGHCQEELPAAIWCWVGITC